MAIRIVKPTTAGQRKMSYLVKNHLSNEDLPKNLLIKKKSTSGRNAHGHITVRHRGGGVKRHIRKVDFLRADKMGIPAKVKALHYDPNRSAFLALLYYVDGEKRLIIAPKELEVGDEIVCDREAKIKTGNRMMLKNIPVGYKIHDLEMYVGRGGQIVRSAGSSARLVSLDGEMAQVELPSKEVRLFNKDCFATIGEVSNEDHSLVRIGKAGRVRKMGRRPQVLGKSMNPCDHPHGGGEGHTSIGLIHPKTPWGAPALGKKTRSKRKPSGKFIVKRRTSRKKK
ncbi:MAG: 50S ribosomal protein L2 [Candidatus Gracilibacteria bacterium]|jgi:large subunit ribosomal protein L2|nr:50S ribosomal protein L2 [Candidatus Gracilibacteria bacterium]